MVSAILYVFAFSTWGLGLVAFISLIGINIEKWNKKKESLDFELKEKTVLLRKTYFKHISSGNDGSNGRDGSKKARSSDTRNS